MPRSRFVLGIDRYQLHRAEELAPLIGKTKDGLLEEATKRALAEYEMRERLPENGYAGKWRLREYSFLTEDPKLIAVSERGFGKFSRRDRAFDLNVARQLERLIIQCEEEFRHRQRRPF